MKERVILTGLVVMGKELGRKIGFPTANLIPEKNKILPVKNGVYAARVEFQGVMYDGMANIGIRPTLEEHTLTIEVHIFDFSEDLYGKEISIYLYDYIRPERKFSRLNDLKGQLLKDQVSIKNILSGRSKTDTNT